MWEGTCYQGISHSTVPRRQGQQHSQFFFGPPIYAHTVWPMATKFDSVITVTHDKVCFCRRKCARVCRVRVISAPKLLGSITYAKMVLHNATKFWRWPRRRGVTFYRVHHAQIRRALPHGVIIFVTPTAHTFLWPPTYLDECCCRRAITMW